VQEIVALEITDGKKPAVFDKDEHNRPDTTADSLAKLKPVFRKDGTITAGNAPGLNSGAAAMIVADAEWAEKHGLEPFARLVSFGVGALERAGWRLADVERAEVNEAFAAIAVALIKEIGLAEDIVNVEGGAIAHGHPIGATGAILTARLLHAMRRDKVKRGLVTLCISGGQGIALALEST
jgi:acetyl-CoA C-acetyltransferase